MTLHKEDKPARDDQPDWMDSVEAFLKDIVFPSAALLTFAVVLVLAYWEAVRWIS